MSLPSPVAVFVQYRLPWRLLGRQLRLFVRPKQLFGAVSGLRFACAGGTGQGLGFSLAPDLTKYAIFTVWEELSAWEDFLSDRLRPFLGDDRDLVTLVLLPTVSRGKWNGVNPLVPDSLGLVDDGNNQPVAVLTRANIRFSRLVHFWRSVPKVDERLRHLEDGLLFSTGFGEYPWVRQATLSVWQNQSLMKSFAYSSPEHRRVIALTRQQGWYSEELFARFAVLKVTGFDSRLRRIAQLINQPAAATSPLAK